jgi:hypothetical protein
LASLQSEGFWWKKKMLREKNITCNTKK